MAETFTRKEIWEEMRRIVAEEFGVEPSDIEDDTRFDSLESEDYDRTDISMYLQEATGIIIPDEEMEEFETVGEAVDWAFENQSKAA